MVLEYHYTIPGYTEESQAGYQGYFVYQVDYVVGKGAKFARTVTGAEKAAGVILRGGEGASATNPLSIVVVKQGRVPVIAGAGGLDINDLVGTAAGGRGIAVTADGAAFYGRCVKAADEGGIALVDVEPYATISDPA
jgi:hypothetical protein